MFSLSKRAKVRQSNAIVALALVLAACTQSTPMIMPQASASPSPFAPSRSIETATTETTVTEQAIPTDTETPSLTSEPPQGFVSEVLRPGILPVSYIGDSCQYYQMRWDPRNSTPGTVVAPIMYHSILPGNQSPKADTDINANYFAQQIELAKNLGFETITTDQLVRFLTENAKIPARAMILILDDRRAGTADEYFKPIDQENGWTTTLAWPIGDTDHGKGKLPDETLWGWMERLNATGYFDIQSHGLNHIYLNDAMSEDTVRQEVSGSIPILKDHFGHRPIAYIWPGGNFTTLGIQIAHDSGFQIAMIERSYGPLQFNWIPLSERERAYNDPLMLLPRFWDTAATLNLQQTADIGDAAREFARENYAAEAAWFSQNCGGELPPLEDVLK
jgi:peptidoglycan/xylan/chitin deacetylase (PgdA/CDA1 family)